MNKLLLRTCGLILAFAATTLNAQQVYLLSEMGLKPHSRKDASAAARHAVQRIIGQQRNNEETILKLQPGEYHFYPKGAQTKTYYISNHDQDNPKQVGLALENVSRLTIDGQGARLIFHGRMLPLSLVNARHCTVKNLSIDFANPQIARWKSRRTKEKRASCSVQPLG